MKGTPRVSSGWPRHPERVVQSPTKATLLPKNNQNKKYLDIMHETHWTNIFLIIPFLVSATTVALPHNWHHLTSKPVFVNDLVSLSEDGPIIPHALEGETCQIRLLYNLMYISSLHESFVTQANNWAGKRIAKCVWRESDKAISVPTGEKLF